MMHNVNYVGVETAPVPRQIDAFHGIIHHYHYTLVVSLLHSHLYFSLPFFRATANIVILNVKIIPVLILYTKKCGLQYFYLLLVTNQNININNDGRYKKCQLRRLYSIYISGIFYIARASIINFNDCKCVDMPVMENNSPRMQKERKKEIVFVGVFKFPILNNTRNKMFNMRKKTKRKDV